MIKPKLGVVPVKAIDAGDRARKEYQNIKELADDIKERNLMHPLVVKEKDDGSGYMLVAGGRRFMAVSLLQWKEVPCNIYPPMDEYDTRSAELAENINREDLTYAERAALVSQVHKLRVSKFGPAVKSSGVGHSLSDTADIVGLSQTAVRRELKLADAIEMIPELAKCKNESQALKLYSRMEEEIIQAELAKRSDEILSNEGADAAKRQLISAYQIGDFFKGADKLDDGTFHCIEVDPPYGMGLPDTKKDDSGGTNNYTEIPAKEYPEFLDSTVSECNRLLRADGWLLFWFAPSQWYTVLSDILSKHGFSFVQPAIWAKQSGQTNWPDRHMASCWEPMFYARKGNGVIFKPGRSNVINFKQVLSDKKRHPTERPIDMMMYILETFTPPGGRVLTPFAGSGNTILAAHNLGMSCIGWDLSKEYKNSYTSAVMAGEVRKYASLQPK